MTEPHDSASNSGAISQRIPDLYADDSLLREDAAAFMCARYAQLVSRIADRQMRPDLKRVEDPEGIAFDVLNSFLMRMREQCFPEIHDRKGIMRLLADMTRKKVSRAAVFHQRGIRDIRRGGTAQPADSDAASPIDHVPDGVWTPAESVALRDQVRHWMALLPSDQHRVIALGKLLDVTDEALAAWFGRATKTIERGKQVLRAVLLALDDWSDEEIAADLECSTERVRGWLDATRQVMKSEVLRAPASNEDRNEEGGHDHSHGARPGQSPATPAAALSSGSAALWGPLLQRNPPRRATPQGTNDLPVGQNPHPDDSAESGHSVRRRLDGERAAWLNSLFQQSLPLLPDDRHRVVALGKFLGETDAMIAAWLGAGAAEVAEDLARVRAVLSELASPTDGASSGAPGGRN